MAGVAGVEVPSGPSAEHAWVLSDDALALVADLQRTFGPRRAELLQRRQERAERDPRRRAARLPARDRRGARRRLAGGAGAGRPATTAACEITGPAERKMMINALNSGAQRLHGRPRGRALADLGERRAGPGDLLDAAHRRSLDFTSPEGKEYRLNEQIATLVVRPRGWHLVEKHVLVDGEPISASLFDFGLHLFHNGTATVERAAAAPTTTCRSWRATSRRASGTTSSARPGRARHPARHDPRDRPDRDDPRGVRDGGDPLRAARPRRGPQRRALGLHLQHHQEASASATAMVLPDRAQVTMAVPFMRAYTQLLVRTCHRRGAHAIGGMAAFIPSRRDAEVNRVALERVREDKEREAGDGFDGTWVAHPDLVPVATRDLRPRARRAARTRRTASARTCRWTAAEPARPRDPGRRDHRGGACATTSASALQYLDAWLAATARRRSTT